MKTILFFLSLTLLFAIGIQSSASAQKQYPFGHKTQSTLTSALTVSVTPRASLVLYELAADTNITINVTKTYSQIGDLVAFKIKANTRARTITFGNYIEAVAPTISTNKTITYLFINNGTNYYALGSFADD